MKKTHLRIITFILAAVLLLTMFSGVAAMVARAADSDPSAALTPENILTADTVVSRTMTRGKVATGLTVTFYFWQSSLSEDEYDFKMLSMPAGSSFSWGERTRLKITHISGKGYYRAVLSNVTYNGGASNILALTVDDDVYFEIPVSNKYFRDASTDEEEIPVPDIVVQSVKLTDGSGQTLDKVTKDTAPFTVEITFYDMGLKDEPRAELTDARIHAFATSATGFKTLSGTGGTVETLNPSGGYPRFRATFKNIKSDGTSSSFGFRIQYDLSNYEKSVKGEATAVLFQVVTAEEDEDEIAPLKPNVIVQSYTYGGETIVAGEEFNLDMEFSNTSKTVGVENVVMTIEPGNGFVIAASSNTMYVPALAPGETKPYSLALRAAASGNVPAGGTAGTQTDYSVQVKFEYQYLSKKEYLTGNTAVKIAIPVVQLDRFSIDEITDYSQYLTAGEEGYVSVPITNKGKSPTYNISAEVRSSGGAEFVAPAVHYGNLEAGKSATVDVSVIINTPGEFSGEAVVLYEDENMNQKQLAMPFSIMVAEPYVPEPEQPDLPAEPESAPINPLRMLFCGLGALMVAVPIALYLIKRVKARGSEDIDESF